LDPFLGRRHPQTVQRQSSLSFVLGSLRVLYELNSLGDPLNFDSPAGAATLFRLSFIDHRLATKSK